MTNRQIVDIRTAHPSRDGDGVAIKRIALVGEPSTDPVLLIDELRSPFREDFAGGFPAHPHRGMQTLTYMKEGGIIHEDSMGNRGEIRGGGAQWMSAASGVIHSEMPTLDTQGLHGFQLWFNLPASEKMLAPRYRDIPADGLARLETDGFVAVAVSGHWRINDGAVTGPLAELVPQASLVDITLGSGTEVTVEIATGDTAIAYVYDGAIERCAGVPEDGNVDAGHMAVAAGGDQWVIKGGAGGAGLLLMTGRPIGEPVVGYGPFVMNTRQEIEQAVRDYQSGRLVQH